MRHDGWVGKGVYGDHGLYKRSSVQASVGVHSVVKKTQVATGGFKVQPG